MNEIIKVTYDLGEESHEFHLVRIGISDTLYTDWAGNTYTKLPEPPRETRFLSVDDQGNGYKLNGEPSGEAIRNRIREMRRKQRQLSDLERLLKIKTMDIQSVTITPHHEYTTEQTCFEHANGELIEKARVRAFLTDHETGLFYAPDDEDAEEITPQLTA